MGKLRKLPSVMVGQGLAPTESQLRDPKFRKLLTGPKVEVITPIRHCPKCGEVIPANGTEQDRYGDPDVHGGKGYVFRTIGLLGCEKCARAASPPRTSETGPPATQLDFGEVPAIPVS